jgi:hypothetical protein
MRTLRSVDSVQELNHIQDYSPMDSAEDRLRSVGFLDQTVLQNPGLLSEILDNAKIEAKKSESIPIT